jgi:hypothetical protein
MRVHHYTWGRSVPGIEAEGLKRSISEEKFKHGGTESPQVFATAGAPSERDLMDTAGGDKHYIEGWAKPEQLDIGRPWGSSHLSSEQLSEHIQGVEGRRSTITFQGDVPKEQILAVHAPWHMAGDYDNIDENTDRALNVSKTALAAKVMVGGKLQGESYADLDRKRKGS